MTSGSHDSEFGAHATEKPTSRAAIPETLVAGAVADRCVSCGSPLSSDQRYCVVCGERRGAPRFSLPASTPAEPSSTVTAAPAPARGGRFSSGTTLVAGVATLLLAMLVGVLIGHDTAAQGSRTVAAAPVRIITTGGGGSTGSASGSGSAAATPTTAAKKPSTTSKKTTASKPSAKKVAPTAAKKTVKAEQGAASKVLGGSGTPPATVTVGATGAGKGYSKKTHKFTGSFFGQ